MYVCMYKTQSITPVCELISRIRVINEFFSIVLLFSIEVSLRKWRGFPFINKRFGHNEVICFINFAINSRLLSDCKTHVVY